MNKLKKWLLENELCDKDGYIWLDNENKVSFEDFIKGLKDISNILNVNILDNKDYNEAKNIMNAFYDNKKLFKEYDLYLEFLNYYLKYILTTYTEKKDIGGYIYSYNNSIDISDINIFSDTIFNELCKWPYMYIVKKDDKIVTRLINNDNHDMYCIPMYSNKDVINDEYLSDEYTIEKVKFNLFVKNIEYDEDNNATVIALNPKFDNHDKVFIELGEDSYWYYWCYSNWVDFVEES